MIEGKVSVRVVHDGRAKASTTNLTPEGLKAVTRRETSRSDPAGGRWHSPSDADGAHSLPIDALDEPTTALNAADKASWLREAFRLMRPTG